MGAVTGKGPVRSDPRGVRFAHHLLLMIALVLTNFTNVIAEFAGIASSLELFHISRYISVPICAVAVWFLVVRGNYRSVEKIFLVACCLYVTYIISAFLLKPDWKEAAIYSVKPILMFDTDYITMLIAMVGTSIAPWMQFYLQSAIVEKGITAKEYVQSRIEVMVGCILTDVVAFFIIVSCATAIWAHGPKDINDAADAAVALKPFGQYAYLLFSAGLFNASFFAACILPLSTVFTVCEGLGFESGVDKRFHEAPEFYWLYTLLVVWARRDPVAEFSAGKDDSGVAGAQRRAAAVRADLHGDADQQEGPDEGMDQFGGLQRGGLGVGGDHDRA
jgi:Mn2+/Fe2+ NRAMP family transporter